MKTPKSLVEVANHLLEQARNEADPELKKLELKYVGKFYDASINAGLQRRLAALLVFIVIVFVGSLVFVVIRVGGWAAIGVGAVEVLLFPLVCAVYLKACGKMTQTGLLTVYSQMYNNVRQLIKTSNTSKSQAGQ